MNVLRTDRARDEIAAAYDYLEERSANAAERLAEQVEQACRVLGANRGSGKTAAPSAPVTSV